MMKFQLNYLQQMWDDQRIQHYSADGKKFWSEITERWEYVEELDEDDD